MNPADFRVRRATIEDLPALTALWQSMNLPANDLERRLTEFQVALNGAGTLVGAVGFQLVARHGLIHSEGFTDFSVADTVRPMFWERLQMVAANHGILRAWTKEHAPFWSRDALNRPDADALAKLPPAWNGLPGEWFTLKLRDDVEEALSLDKEFDLFKQSARSESEAVLARARLLKTIATIVAIILALGVVAGAIYLLQKDDVNLPRLGR